MCLTVYCGEKSACSGLTYMLQGNSSSKHRGPAQGLPPDFQQAVRRHRTQAGSGDGAGSWRQPVRALPRFAGPGTRDGRQREPCTVRSWACNQQKLRKLCLVCQSSSSTNCIDWTTVLQVWLQFSTAYG